MKSKNDRKYPTIVGALLAVLALMTIFASSALADTPTSTNTGGSQGQVTNDSSSNTAAQVVYYYNMMNPDNKPFSVNKLGLGGKDQLSYINGTSGPMQSTGPGTVVSQTLVLWPEPNFVPPVTPNIVATHRDEGINSNMLTTYHMPLSDSQFQYIHRMDQNILLDELFDPSRFMWAAQVVQQTAGNQMANNAMASGSNQSQNAIEFTRKYLVNFTADPTNEWNTIRNQLFVPMAILLLLPGAVLAQVRAIVAQGYYSVFGEINPFEGILRSMVAIFLIPGTYLVMNYGIDVSNSISYTIADQYLQIFGYNMYDDAKCTAIRANTANPISRDRNAITTSEPPAPSTSNEGGADPFENWEANTLVTRQYDPCANTDTTVNPDEDIRASRTMNRFLIGVMNMGLGTTWNIMCAFQVVYLYYLWCMGPIVAALWVWPIDKLRAAFPSWVEGVIILCFWSLFWNTTVLIMACFRGVGDNGDAINAACQSLANLSVVCAFDFGSLISQAASQMQSSVAQKVAGGSMQGAQQSQAGGSPGGGRSGGGGARRAAAGGGAGGRAGGAAGGSPTGKPAVAGATPGAAGLLPHTVGATSGSSSNSAVVPTSLTGTGSKSSATGAGGKGGAIDPAAGKPLTGAAGGVTTGGAGQIDPKTGQPITAAGGGAVVPPPPISGPGTGDPHATTGSSATTVSSSAAVSSTSSIGVGVGGTLTGAGNAVAGFAQSHPGAHSGDLASQLDGKHGAVDPQLASFLKDHPDQAAAAASYLATHPGVSEAQLAQGLAANPTANLNTMTGAQVNGMLGATGQAGPLDNQVLGGPSGLTASMDAHGGVQSVLPDSALTGVPLATNIDTTATGATNPLGAPIDGLNGATFAKEGVGPLAPGQFDPNHVAAGTQAIDPATHQAYATYDGQHWNGAGVPNGAVQMGADGHFYAKDAAGNQTAVSYDHGHWTASGQTGVSVDSSGQMVLSGTNAPVTADASGYHAHLAGPNGGTDVTLGAHGAPSYASDATGHQVPLTMGSDGSLHAGALTLGNNGFEVTGAQGVQAVHNQDGSFSAQVGSGTFTANGNGEGAVYRDSVGSVALSAGSDNHLHAGALTLGSQGMEVAGMPGVAAQHTAQGFSADLPSGGHLTTQANGEGAVYRDSAGAVAVSAGSDGALHAGGMTLTSQGFEVGNSGVYANHTASGFTAEVGQGRLTADAAGQNAVYADSYGKTALTAGSDGQFHAGALEVGRNGLEIAGTGAQAVHEANGTYQANYAGGTITTDATGGAAVFRDSAGSVALTAGSDGTLHAGGLTAGQHGFEVSGAPGVTAERYGDAFKADYANGQAVFSSNGQYASYTDAGGGQMVLTAGSDGAYHNGALSLGSGGLDVAGTPVHHTNDGNYVANFATGATATISPDGQSAVYRDSVSAVNFSAGSDGQLHAGPLTLGSSGVELAGVPGVMAQHQADGSFAAAIQSPTGSPVNVSVDQSGVVHAQQGNAPAVEMSMQNGHLATANGAVTLGDHGFQIANSSIPVYESAGGNFAASLAPANGGAPIALNVDGASGHVYAQQGPNAPAVELSMQNGHLATAGGAVTLGDNGFQIANSSIPVYESARGTFEGTITPAGNGTPIAVSADSAGHVYAQQGQNAPAVELSMQNGHLATAGGAVTLGDNGFQIANSSIPVHESARGTFEGTITPAGSGTPIAVSADSAGHVYAQQGPNAPAVELSMQNGHLATAGGAVTLGDNGFQIANSSIPVHESARGTFEGTITPAGSGTPIAVSADSAGHVYAQQGPNAPAVELSMQNGHLATAGGAVTLGDNGFQIANSSIPVHESARGTFEGTITPAGSGTPIAVSADSAGHVYAQQGPNAPAVELSMQNGHLATAGGAVTLGDNGFQIANSSIPVHESARGTFEGTITPPGNGTPIAVSADSAGHVYAQQGQNAPAVELSMQNGHLATAGGAVTLGDNGFQIANSSIPVYESAGGNFAASIAPASGGAPIALNVDGASGHIYAQQGNAQAVEMSMHNGQLSAAGGAVTLGENGFQIAGSSVSVQEVGGGNFAASITPANGGAPIALNVDGSTGHIQAYQGNSHQPVEMTMQNGQLSAAGGAVTLGENGFQVAGSSVPAYETSRGTFEAQYASASGGPGMTMSLDQSGNATLHNPGAPDVSLAYHNGSFVAADNVVFNPSAGVLQTADHGTPLAYNAQTGHYQVEGASNLYLAGDSHIHATSTAYGDQSLTYTHGQSVLTNEPAIAYNPGTDSLSVPSAPQIAVTPQADGTISAGTYNNQPVSFDYSTNRYEALPQGGGAPIPVVPNATETGWTQAPAYASQQPDPNQAPITSPSYTYQGDPSYAAAQPVAPSVTQAETSYVQGLAQDLAQGPGPSVASSSVPESSPAPGPAPGPAPQAPQQQQSGVSDEAVSRAVQAQFDQNMQRQAAEQAQQQAQQLAQQQAQQQADDQVRMAQGPTAPPPSTFNSVLSQLGTWGAAGIASSRNQQKPANDPQQPPPEEVASTDAPPNSTGQSLQDQMSPEAAKRRARGSMSRAQYRQWCIDNGYNPDEYSGPSEIV